MSEFQEDLLGCFSIIKPGVIASLPGGICYLQATAIDKIYNQGRIIPFLCTLSFGCFGGAMNRYMIRKKYEIKGSYLSDALVWTFFPCCASIQEYKEVYRR